MGQKNSRPNIALDTECVHEPCVLLKYTTNTADNHPHQVDEVVVGPGDIDGGRENSFWKWPALHFRRRRAAKYDLAQAEKDFQHNAGSYRRFRQAPTSEVLPAAEEQPEQDVLVKAPTSEVLPAAEEQPEQDVLVKDPICERYIVGQKLGEGAFGSVYEGTRRKDGLKVAMKFSQKRRHMQYIKVPGHLKHLPNEIGLTLMANKGHQVSQIIKLLDWEDNTDNYIMVMERPFPCMDLLGFMKLHGFILDEQTARHIMWQVIHAAQICCKRGVFHRDIKLENLLVNQDTMEVKLIDFGCGALMNNTAFRVFRGTLVYCPPEVKINGVYHAEPTTVWSLGILLFAMVSGGYPSGRGLFMINANTWSSPGLSQECRQMICDCLQPCPEQRLILNKMHLHDWFKVMELDREVSRQLLSRPPC